MTGEVALLLAEIGAPRLGLLAGVAFVAATVSGMSGVGGGLLLAIFIAPIVGVKAVVPTVGVATLIAHVVRVWVYRENIVWRPALVMLAGRDPGDARQRAAVRRLPADVIAVILGIFLLASIPLRRLMARRELRFGSRSLGADRRLLRPARRHHDRRRHSGDPGAARRRARRHGAARHRRGDRPRQPDHQDRGVRRLRCADARASAHRLPARPVHDPGHLSRALARPADAPARARRGDGDRSCVLGACSFLWRAFAG